MGLVARGKDKVKDKAKDERDKERRQLDYTPLKMFVCTTFQGHWPVGTAAVIVHRSMKLAEMALLKELKSKGLEQKEKDKKDIVLKELKIDEPGVYVLNDGDY